jgi:hypothetical protein
MVVIKQQKTVEFLNHGIQQPEKEKKIFNDLVEEKRRGISGY